MRVKQIKYSMLRHVANRDTDIAEVKIIINPGDSKIEAIHRAKNLCWAMLHLGKDKYK